MLKLNMSKKITCSFGRHNICTEKATVKNEHGIDMCKPCLEVWNSTEFKNRKKTY
jgi:hypothetical protein